MYSYTPLSNVNSSNRSNIPLPNSNVRYGRVVKTLLTEEEGDLSVGGIKFRYLQNDQQEVEENSLPFAYRLESNLKVLPLRGEIVEILEAPTEILDQTSSLKKLYYRNIVNIWNNPNRSSFPDIYQFEDERDWVEEGVIDQSNKPGLFPFPGDVLIEGRNGQSIRMGGFATPNNSFTDESNNGKPFILLRNSSNSGKEGSFTLEDINLDESSIFLTSDHKVDIKPGRIFGTSYKKSNKTPDKVDKFKGAQVVLNSDRIVVNSKKDSILLSSANSVGITGLTVNVEANDYVGIEASKIFIGQEAINLPDSTKQPAVLGIENKNLMNEIIASFAEISNTFLTLPTNAAGISAQLNVLGSVLQAQNTYLLFLLEKINSKKVFIDSGN